MTTVTDITKKLAAIKAEINRLHREGNPDEEVIALYRKKANRLIDQMSVKYYAEHCYLVTLDELFMN